MMLYKHTNAGWHGPFYGKKLKEEINRKKSWGFFLIVKEVVVDNTNIYTLVKKTEKQSSSRAPHYGNTAACAAHGKGAAQLHCT